jgi:hypothetical protein
VKPPAGETGIAAEHIMSVVRPPGKTPSGVLWVQGEKKRRRRPWSGPAAHHPVLDQLTIA